jgi:phage terminase large subunit GpA-like protein
MEVFADNRVSDIAVQCSAQSSKTQTVMNLACWAVSEDPGPAMWVMAAKDDVKDFVRDRFAPTANACEPVARQIIAEERLEFVFASCPLYFVGAGSPSKLQSKPIRWLFLDEVRNYPPGALETVLKRTRAFWNSRRLIISTADMENDTVDRAYKAGDQRVFHFPCPACALLQPLRMEQLRWDTNDQTKPGGTWEFDVLAPTIRYECAACGHPIRDVPAERKAIARTGRYVRMNPGAPRHRVSFHWNALLPPWVSWRSIVEEFLAARAAARGGDIQPMKTFVNETLGEPWKDQLGEIEDFDFLMGRRGEYDFGEPWAEERVRFISADRQAAGGEHYWYVVRAFGPFGKSRLVTYGRCNSTLELEEVRVSHKVPIGNAIVDSGFRASEVYRFCQSTGWKPFKGDDAEWFAARDPRTEKVVRRLWQKTRVDPAYGTRLQGRVRPLPLYRWSNPGMKDLLFEHLTGLVGEWSIPREIGRDYLKQITAEHRVEERDARGRVRYRWHQKHRDNHLLDCELQLMTVAAMTGLVIAAPTVKAS